MTKTANKFENFNNAIKRLNEANIAYRKNKDDNIYQDALIKRFEFTYELAWKTLREYLIESGYRLETVSPKGVFSYAYQEGILDDENIWLDMLKSRNLTAHDYGQELSAEIADHISTRYSKALSLLGKYISEHIK